MNLKNKVDSDLNDDDDHPKNQYLGYFVRGISVNEYTVHINEPIQMPEYYTNTVNALSGCSKHDTVKFFINSPGGFLVGLVSLLDAIAKTEATTIAVLTGECHSAASILALHCDYVEVGPYATSLCHNVRYGSSGKSSDIVDHVMHMSSVSEKLVRETYSGYLTEQEILDLLKGKEFYMESDEIVSRLKTREDYLTGLESEGEVDVITDEVMGDSPTPQEIIEQVSKKKSKRLTKG